MSRFVDLIGGGLRAQGTAVARLVCHTSARAGRCATMPSNQPSETWNSMVRPAVPLSSFLAELAVKKIDHNVSIDSVRDFRKVENHEKRRA